MEFDFIIVGGGAAGCVLARRLAEAGHAVGLLEAGPTDAGVAEIAALGRYNGLLGGPYDYGYEVARTPPATGIIRQPRGRVLGGSSSINTCIWFPTPRADLELWEAGGATGWGPAGTAAARARLAAMVPTQSADTADPASIALSLACRQAGFPLVPFDAPFDEGVGWLRLAWRGGRRLSAAVTYLHDRPPAGLAVLTGHRADRLLFDAEGRAAGVATPAGPVRARREVVLSAGVYETPKLLMLSGIGPAAALAPFGIPVGRNLPGVGQHLVDHPVAAVNWRAMATPAPIEPYNWASALFARSRPEAPLPDLELHLGSTALNRYSPLSREGGFTIMPSVARARSEGRVTLASPDPADRARVEPRFFTDPEGADMAAAIAGIRLARRLARQPALAPWIAEELLPGPAVQSDADLAAYVLATHGTDYHAAGTCRMGRRDDPATVVGPDLRVHGVPGLRIADASIFPSMVGVNIVATCMMIGEKAADLILDRRSERP